MPGGAGVLIRRPPRATKLNAPRSANAQAALVSLMTAASAGRLYPEKPLESCHAPLPGRRTQPRHRHGSRAAPSAPTRPLAARRERPVRDATASPALPAGLASSKARPPSFRPSCRSCTPWLAPIWAAWNSASWNRRSGSEQGHVVAIAAPPGSETLKAAHERSLEAVGIDFESAYSPSTVLGLRRLVKRLRIEVIDAHSRADGKTSALCQDLCAVVRTRHFASTCAPACASAWNGASAAITSSPPAAKAATTSCRPASRRPNASAWSANGPTSVSSWTWTRPRCASACALNSGWTPTPSWSPPSACCARKSARTTCCAWSSSCASARFPPSRWWSARPPPKAAFGPGCARWPMNWASRPIPCSPAIAATSTR